MNTDYKLTTSSPNANFKISTYTNKHKKYYNKNKDKINTTKLINYQINKPHYKITSLSTQNTNKKYQKSNDLITYYIDYFRLDKLELETENKPILSFYDLLEYAWDNLHPQKSVSSSIPMKPRFFVLPLILISMMEQGDITSLDFIPNFGLTEQQLERYMQLLVNLRWVIRRGKNDFASYYVNPFLSVLYEDLGRQALGLTFFTQLKLDFFDVLNMPLVSALKSRQKIKNSKVEFYKFGLGSHSQWVKAIFEGYVNIELIADNGDIYQTYLPSNFHACPKLQWENKQKKLNSYGFPHHTIPLSWKLFDIIEGRTYSKKAREKRRSKEVGECEYIHFDTSFKILHYSDLMRRLSFTYAFKYALEKWNKGANQYVEVSSFNLLEKLFYYRFVENKRRTELFDVLNLKYKPISGRPKKPK